MDRNFDDLKCMRDKIENIINLHGVNCKIIEEFDFNATYRVVGRYTFVLYDIRDEDSLDLSFGFNNDIMTIEFELTQYSNYKPDEDGYEKYVFDITMQKMDITHCMFKENIDLPDRHDNEFYFCDCDEYFANFIEPKVHIYTHAFKMGFKSE